MIRREELDKRYNATKQYLKTGKGKPIYRKYAFPHIRKILGPNYKWITKSVEEYYGNERLKELEKAIYILNFQSENTFREIKKKYWMMAKGNSKKNIRGWHPDMDGHEGAFDLLTHAYNIFKEANYNNK